MTDASRGEGQMDSPRKIEVKPPSFGDLLDSKFAMLYTHPRARVDGIAKMFGVSRETVRLRARRLNLKAPARIMGKDERDRQIVDMIRSGLSYAAIADELGLSPKGVKGMCKRLGVRSGLSADARKSKYEVARKMWSEGASASDVAAALGMTRRGARSMISRLGLPTCAGAGPINPIAREQWNERNAKVVAMLLAGVSVDEVAADVGLSVTSIGEIRRRNGIPPRGRSFRGITATQYHQARELEALRAEVVDLRAQLASRAA